MKSLKKKQDLIKTNLFTGRTTDFISTLGTRKTLRISCGRKFLRHRTGKINPKARQNCNAKNQVGFHF